MNAEKKRALKLLDLINSLNKLLNEDIDINYQNIANMENVTKQAIEARYREIGGSDIVSMYKHDQQKQRLIKAVLKMKSEDKFLSKKNILTELERSVSTTKKLRNLIEEINQENPGLLDKGLNPKSLAYKFYENIKNIDTSQLTIDEMRSLNPGFTNESYSVFLYKEKIEYKKVYKHK